MDNFPAPFQSRRAVQAFCRSELFLYRYHINSEIASTDANVHTSASRMLNIPHWYMAAPILATACRPIDTARKALGRRPVTVIHTRMESTMCSVMAAMRYSPGTRSAPADTPPASCAETVVAMSLPNMASSEPALAADSTIAFERLVVPASRIASMPPWPMP